MKEKQRKGANRKEEINFLLSELKVSKTTGQHYQHQNGDLSYLETYQN
jgi:hypothetical protein